MSVDKLPRLRLRRRLCLRLFLRNLQQSLRVYIDSEWPYWGRLCCVELLTTARKQYPQMQTCLVWLYVMMNVACDDVSYVICDDVCDEACDEVCCMWRCKLCCMWWCSCKLCCMWWCMWCCIRWSMRWSMLHFDDVSSVLSFYVMMYVMKYVMNYVACDGARNDVCL